MDAEESKSGPLSQKHTVLPSNLQVCPHAYCMLRSADRLVIFTMSSLMKHISALKSCQTSSRIYESFHQPMSATSSYVAYTIGG
jgi:hypothetical protein